MLRTLCVALATCAFVFAPISEADAQKKAKPAAIENADSPRVYDLGPVWSVAYIQTLPGGFDAYTRYLASGWRKFMEADKARGDVLQYNVVSVTGVRDGEPDILLITQYKNMAVFDRSLADLDATEKSVFGSLTESEKAAVSREGIRKLRGEIIGRELVFVAPPTKVAAK